MALEIIHIIEDEPDHARLLDLTLRKARYRTNVAMDGLIGLEDVRRLQPALVLLDVMLPEMDGYEVCRRIREDRRGHDIPIIMLSALGTEAHRVVGFSLGVDDYIVKPFSPKEVVARVAAVLRRGHKAVGQPEVYLDGEVVLEESRFIVSLRGRTIELSALGWRILQRLVRRNKEVVTWEELLMALWGDTDPQHQHELERQVLALADRLAQTGYDRTIAMIPGVGCTLNSHPS
jgi:DNA-binding response OmpR family regulator